MNNNIIFLARITASHVDSFNALCKPLFDCSNIDSILYSRVYKNGEYFTFNTNAKLNEFTLFDSYGKFNFDINFLDIVFSIKLFSKDHDNKICMFTEDINDVEYWNILFREFSIKSVLNVVEKFDDYYEIFSFITCNNKSFYSFYINHYDALEKFILYFREHGADLIKIGEQNKVPFFNENAEYKSVIQGLQNMVSKNHNPVDNLKASFKLKKYPLIYDDTKVYITPGELKCLLYMGQGFTHKEIGNILKISDRTVGAHLRHIKSKMGIYSTDKILKIFNSSKLVLSKF